MMAGEFYGNFKYFENTGTATASVFALLQTNPFGLTDIGYSSSSPTFVDIDNNTYTTSNNTATVNIVGGVVNGCDSLVTLNLTINTVDNTTSLNVDTIIANQTGASYQWLDCNNGNAIIAGATNQSFRPSATGDYAVEVTFNGCVDTSACVNVIITSINELAIAGINIYPNPINNNFVIEFGDNSSLSGRLGGASISIYSVDGKLVYKNAILNSNKLVIDATTWSKGVYFVNITTDKVNNTLKMIKQ